MKCARTISDDGLRPKTCKNDAVAYVCGQWVCARHEPKVTGNCSHSLAPSGRCSYCGAKTVAQNAVGEDTDARQQPAALTATHPAAPATTAAAPSPGSGLPPSAPEAVTRPVRPTPQPRARRSDPATSHQAARRASSTANATRLLVLRAHAEAGPQGLTGDELAAAIGIIRYEVCGPRRADLRDLHQVAPQLDDRGRQVERGGKGVWQITDAGYAAAARMAVA